MKTETKQAYIHHITNIVFVRTKRYKNNNVVRSRKSFPLSIKVPNIPGYYYYGFMDTTTQGSVLGVTVNHTHNVNVDVLFIGNRYLRSRRFQISDIDVEAINTGSNDSFEFSVPINGVVF